MLDIASLPGAAISGGLSIALSAVAAYLHPRELFWEYRATESGNAGERRVASALAGAGLRALHDVTVTVGGKTHQLDHIVAGRDRLFVIETKTWRGDVHGRIDGRTWTLRQPGRSPIRAYNPVRQNTTHAQALARVSGVPVAQLVVSAGHVRVSAELAEYVVPLHGLTARFDASGEIGPAIAAAFDRLAAVKGDPRQARIAARHRARLRSRYGAHLSHACWFGSAVSLAFTLLAAWQATQR